MPYKLSPDGLSVIQSDTGKVVKKHPNKAKAKAHLLALRMNVKEAKPDQDSKKKKSGSPKYPMSKRKKLEALQRFVEAGARHSKTDSGYIQEAHDACVKAGAMCGGSDA
jgi:hypothetical protein